MNKLLSICIPTLNRSFYLEQLLDSICQQTTPDMLNDFDLCISDDSADDETEILINKYLNIAKFNIHYKRNYVNNGLEAAILDCISMSSAEYCWVVSDDDLIIEGGIKLVLQHLKTNKYDYMVVESNSFNDKTGKNLFKLYGLEEKEYNNNEQFNEILSAIFIAMTHICVSIFNRIMWSQCLNKDKILKYKYFPHMKVILDKLPQSNKKSLTLSTAVINARAYNYSYARNSLEVFFYHLYIVLDSLDNYTSESKDMVRNKIKKAMFVKLIRFPALVFSKAFYGMKDNCYLVDYDIYRKIKKNLTHIERIKMLFVISIPKWVLYLLRPVIAVFFNIYLKMR